jgi:hypothetical protein
MGHKCKFDLAWVGECGKEGCTKHADVKCVSCGNPATRECDATDVLVCGAPLCDDCDHTIQSNGCNSGGELPEGLQRHCRKVDQVFKPWFVTELAEIATP